MQISDMIPGVNIVGGKWNIASVNRAWGGSGGVLHLDWLKIDLNAAKIITVQDYKHQKTNVNESTHIQC